MGISVRALTLLISNGNMSAVRLPDGSLAVSEERAKRGVVKPTRKEDLPEYRDHAHLKGVEIGVNEASRRYGVSNRTIGRWVKQGYIACLRRDGQRVLIDEADVAYCARIHRTRGGQGRWLFNQDGTPYTPKRSQG
jgi:excisionase family DNA binding protein